MKRTKIVATLGPASETKQILTKMVRSGLNVARLNFSHGTYPHHRLLLKNVKAAAKSFNKTIAILQDLQGPRIRIGDVGNIGIKVKKNQTIKLTYSLKPVKKGKDIIIPVHYKNLYKDLKKDAKILIEDGTIELKVEKISNQVIHCQTIIGGTIKTYKGMNFPGSSIKADPLTKKDLTDLEFGIKNKVDFVALSFVKNAKDINNLRKRILILEKKFKRLSKGQKIPITKIIAKIERQEAINNFNKILKAVDGIMVARGDLGVELPFEDVPLIQKEIIYKCNRAGKPVIVATQMLDSMIRNPRPTRAEISDVANAILDGTDAIMLSGESATGKYPLEAVRAMNRIADEVEPTEFKIQQDLEPKLKRLSSLNDFVAYNAQDMAEKLKAKAIICLTTSGLTARTISRYKSKVPVLAFTENENIKNQLNLSWGITSYKIGFSNSYQTLIENILKLLRKQKKLKKGTSVVVCLEPTISLAKKNKLVQIEQV